MRTIKKHSGLIFWSTALILLLGSMLTCDSGGGGGGGGGGCTNLCSTSGSLQCYNTTAYQTCGNYDSDSCLEWSSATNCGAGETCINGLCVPGILPTPKNLTATLVSCTQVTFVWDLVQEANQYSIYRDGALLNNINAPPSTDGTVNENTTYSYQVSCSNATQSSEKSPAVIVTTPTCTPPAHPPTGLRSTSLGCNQIDLAWDSVSGATYYEVYRDGSLAGSPNSNNYSDTGLSQNTSYSYSVAACNSAGCSSQGSPISLTTLTVPTSPASPTISNQTCDSLMISWGTVTGASSYKVYRNGTEVGSPASPPFTDTGLTKNTTYTYSIVACSACGCSAPSSSNTGTTTDIPITPAAPSVGSPTCSTLTITWTAVAGASSYMVYRDGIQVGSPTSNSYTDSGLSASASYSYSIAACNNCGCSLQSASTSGSTTGTPNTPPAPSLSGQTCSSITLTWPAVTGATSYQVYRGGTQIYTTTLTNYTNTGLSAGTNYCYNLVACNSCGCSATGSQACTSTTGIPAIPDAPSAIPSCTSISLSWPAVAGADSYKVFRNGTQVGAPTSAAYNDSGLTMGTPYSYALQACNSCDCSTTGSSASFTTGNKPSIPETPTVSSPGCSSLTISWSSVSGATSYRVYRNGTQIATPSSSPYTDSGLLPNTTYSYTISSCNTCGCSNLSGSASETTTSPACTSYSQCYDGIYCTQDVCNNQGMCSSYCSNPVEPITLHCGTDTLCIKTCSGNCAWVGTYTDYRCDGFGSCQSYSTNCGSATCLVGSQKCSGGSCVSSSETCNGADDDCDGDVDEGLSDLQIISFSANQSTQDISYTIQYKNAGTCSTYYGFSTGIWHHRSISGEADAYCVIYYPGLAAGASQTCTRTVPDSSYGSGTSYAEVDYVDYYPGKGEVLESIESNNNPSPISVCVPDQYEDNDSCANAYSFGTINNTSKSYLATLTDSGEFDWYAFYLTDDSIGDTLNITLTSSPYSSYVLYLYNTCSSMPSGVTGQGTQSISWNGTWGNDSGWYYIKVQSTSGQSDCNDSYQLNISESF